MIRTSLAAAALAFATFALPGAATAAPAHAGIGQLAQVGAAIDTVQYRRWDRPRRYYRGPVRCRLVTERRVRPSGRVVLVRREVCRRW